jgi:sterol desaturase/sphingolipid hydroxylase (fatty acid hydroxylase superfamily)
MPESSPPAYGAGMASPDEPFSKSLSVPIRDTAQDKPLARVGSWRFHAGLLGLLSLLFVGRVVAQLIQYFNPIDVLPRFEQWQSGALPYGVLVVLQLAIVGGQLRVVGAVHRGQHLLGQQWRRVISALAIIYLAVMVLRLIAGLTFATGGGWLDARLPTIFHLVLAAFLLVWMHHESGGRSTVGSAGGAAAGTRVAWAARVFVYPVVSIGACLAFYLLDRSGTPTAVAAYGPILLAAILITVAEQRWPYRAAWAPDGGTITTDVAFMAVVQMVVPAFAAIAFALCASAFADSVWEVHDLWPQHLPGIVQVVLMLIVADFLRYWQHRAMHRSPTLWRLHAVHHSPDRLYWLNVGRFHPLEEVLQSLVETLPFVILGVDARVLAGYYVFYAVNGFFQHSNCDVRLGPLNQLVAGPELHRWHHAAEIREANHNYGNKLIIWDTFFGTRFLPADREVGELGNGEPTYPTTFVGQVAAPFRRAVAS